MTLGHTPHCLWTSKLWVATPTVGGWGLPISSPGPQTLQDDLGRPRPLWMARTGRQLLNPQAGPGEGGHFCGSQKFLPLLSPPGFSWTHKLRPLPPLPLKVVGRSPFIFSCEFLAASDNHNQPTKTQCSRFDLDTPAPTPCPAATGHGQSSQLWGTANMLPSKLPALSRVGAISPLNR